jgi:hypothetical protein
MSDATDNLNLEQFSWDGCTFWYDADLKKFEVYEKFGSPYNFSIQRFGNIWMASAFSYGSTIPDGVLNWLSDFRGRSLVELLSLVVIVYKDKTESFVFNDWNCPASKEIIERAARLREHPPMWVKKFERFEPKISSDYSQ